MNLINLASFLIVRVFRYNISKHNTGYHKKNYIDITYQVNVNEIDMLEKIIHNLKKKYPTISVTYLDQNQVPSI